jgi:hypothetical protein
MRWLLAVVVSVAVSPTFGQGESAAEIFATQIAPVLTHARCLNCHTKSNFPRQGDERRRHDFLVSRGGAGDGAAGLHCSTCHQDANQANGVPGAPNRHLAPLSMAWEDLSAGSLCRRLKERSRNGDRDLDALISHISDDRWVGWGWDPGGERKPIPVARQVFAQNLARWQALGAACPD